MHKLPKMIEYIQLWPSSFLEIPDLEEAISKLPTSGQFLLRNTAISEPDEQELRGAELSLDKAWANSSGLSEEPTIMRETIALKANNAAYELAAAPAGAGKGVWTIAFGSSDSNPNNHDSTLAPVVDEAGRPVMDRVYNKPIYSNSAITLSVPEKIKIHPVQYETGLTWILAALP